MKKSLKFKLLLMFFVFIFIPLAVLGFMSSIKTTNSMQEMTEGELNKIANSTSELMVNSLKSAHRFVSVLSYNDDIASSLLSNEKESAFSFIKNIKDQNSDLTELLAVVDNTGKVVYTSEEQTPNIDLGDRAYVKAALSGVVGQSDVIISKFTNKPVVAIAHPIRKRRNCDWSCSCYRRF